MPCDQYLVTLCIVYISMSELSGFADELPRDQLYGPPCDFQNFLGKSAWLCAGAQAGEGFLVRSKRTAANDQLRGCLGELIGNAFPHLFWYLQFIVDARPLPVLHGVVVSGPSSASTPLWRQDWSCQSTFPPPRSMWSIPHWLTLELWYPLGWRRGWITSHCSGHYHWMRPTSTVG